MKKGLKIVLSAALALVLAGSLSNTAQAHSGHHSRRAKGVSTAAYTAGRNQSSGTAGSTEDDNAVTDSVTADAAAIGSTIPAAPAQASDTTSAYAACYENGGCTGDNLCDVNGVCQNGGICNGTPCNASCYQGGTCLQNGSCDVNGICQNGGSCYGTVNQNTSSGSYGHHGGGRHGGRHHR